MEGNMWTAIVTELATLKMELVAMESFYLHHELYSIGAIDREQYIKILNEGRSSLVDRINSILKECKMIEEMT